MGNYQYCSGKRHEGVFENFYSFHIEIVRGLVEDYQVCGCGKHFGEHKAVFFASRKRADLRHNARRIEQKALQIAHYILALAVYRHVFAAASDKFKRSGLRVELPPQLVEVGNF